MIKCKNCNTINEDDAIFCKKCGLNLEINNEIKEKESKGKKTKVKTKKKTKIKKVKEKNNNKNQKNNNKKNNNKNVIIKKQTPIFSKLLILLLFIVCITLALAFSYYILNNEVVEVPSVTNMTYENAEIRLAKANLKIRKIIKETEKEEENNIVLSQNKEEGTKVRKNSKITIEVGKYEKIYYLDDFTYMNIESVKSILDSNSLKYEINYKEVNNLDSNIVLSQTPKKGTKMKNINTVKLTISKRKEIKKEVNENKESIIEQEEINNNDEE